MVKYIFGGSGLGNTIGADEGRGFESSLITIGPGAACGIIIGDAEQGCGIEITRDCGGPVGKMIGGSFDDFLGKLMNRGPIDGPGTMTCGDEAGKGGNSVKTVFGFDPGGGNKPELDNVFSSGNKTVGGIEEIDVGSIEDIAASNKRIATDDISFNAVGDDDIAVNKDTRVDGGKVSMSFGVADNVFTMDTSAEEGKVLSVDDEHKVDSRDIIGEGQPGN